MFMCLAPIPHLSSGMLSPIPLSIDDAFKATKNYDIRTLKRFIQQTSTRQKELKDDSLEITLNRQDNSGATMLHWACYCGALDAVQLLCASGSSPSAREHGGKVPLHWAAYEGHFDVCLYMLEKLPSLGISVNPVSEEQDGLTPCHLAILGNHDNVARLFPNYDAVILKPRNSLDPIELLVDPNTHQHLTPSHSHLVSSMGATTVNVREQIPSPSALSQPEEIKRRRKEKRIKKRDSEREQLMRALLIALASQSAELSASEERSNQSTKPSIKWCPTNPPPTTTASELDHGRTANETFPKKVSYFIQQRGNDNRPPWKPPANTYIPRTIRDAQRPLK